MRFSHCTRMCADCVTHCLGVFIPIKRTCSCGINHSWYQAVHRTYYVTICDHKQSASSEYAVRIYSIHFLCGLTTHDLSCANNCNTEHLIGFYFRQFSKHVARTHTQSNNDLSDTESHWKQMNQFSFEWISELIMWKSRRFFLEWIKELSVSYGFNS